MPAFKQHRIALSIYFFLAGFSFSSWTSRIPTIKDALHLNEAELGSILFTMPVSSMIGLPLSSWLVTRYETRIPLLAGFLFNALCLASIGFADTTFTLIIALVFYALSMRVMNISLNTQAVTLQNESGKKINGSFHGLWSTGGIAGVAFTTLLVSLKVPIIPHLLAVSAIVILAPVLTYRFLVRNDQSEGGSKLSFRKPEPFILYLGLLAFLAMVCEGGMFDWSGIYFQKVIGEEIFTAGYLIFMIFMASSRFISDRLINRFGLPVMYMISALFIFSGVLLAILLPTFWPAMAGFSLVGFGTASVIPMTYSLAGTSKHYSPGIAISIIATFGIAGMLAGPPMIGYLAHAFNLKIAFILFAVSGLTLIPVSRLFFKLKE